MGNDRIRDSFVVEAGQQFLFAIVILAPEARRSPVQQVERLLHKIYIQVLIVAYSVEQGVVRLQSSCLSFDSLAICGAIQNLEIAKGKSLERF